MRVLTISFVLIGMLYALYNAIGIKLASDFAADKANCEKMATMPGIPKDDAIQRAVECSTGNRK